MKLVSSNKNKIAEFKSILGNLIEIVPGKDLKEIQGTMDEVIIYKSLDAGVDFVVEDTILIIDGVEVVDIKWNQEDKLKNCKKASWVTSLGYNDGENIFIYRGIINGIIVEPKVDGFGFDPYFLPDGSDLTLSELDKENKKDLFSARKIALSQLLNKIEIIKKSIKEIPLFTGKYQNEN